LELAGLFERAKAQHGRGELDEALASVNEGLAVAPNAAELLALRKQLRSPVAESATPEALEYMRKGDRYWELGDVASARLFYEAAAASGYAKAMLAVGTSYDPTIATRLGLIVHSNAVLAAKWYRKALEGGAPAAPRHLELLRIWYRKNEAELGIKQQSELEVLLAQ
jgi:TPR repeat protein